MTRNESDKEDLIKDATAMVDRAEFSAVSAVENPIIVTAGFRKDSSLGLYFAQDPFYQFAPDGLLRRAYENGFLYRSQTTTLARLNRTRTAQQTTLNRNDLNPTELQGFRCRMTARLQCFVEQLEAGTTQRLRSVTDKSNFDTILIEALNHILQIDTPFLSTAINTRK